MSGGHVCRCPESRKPLAERAWVVLQRKCNYSTFNGRRFTPSDYSAVSCEMCFACWRTKADYVYELRYR